MNKLIPLIFFIIISGCSNHNKFEKCADSMFLLTNELMTKRMRHTESSRTHRSTRPQSRAGEMEKDFKSTTRMQSES